jgi:hypothetical protein
MLSEGNQIHNFISSSGSGTVINYGSGSDFLTSYGSGLQGKKLRFRFWFHNTGVNHGKQELRKNFYGVSVVEGWNKILSKN